jgi:hypothetical protein
MRVPELGVRLYGRSSVSADAARRDGKKALQDLLSGLADEERKG